MGISAMYVLALKNGALTSEQLKKFEELKNTTLKELGADEYNANSKIYIEIFKFLSKDKDASIDDVKKFKEQLDFMKNERGIQNCDELLANFNKMLRSHSAYPQSKVSSDELFDMFVNYFSGVFPVECTSMEDYITRCLKGELKKDVTTKNDTTGKDADNENAGAEGAEGPKPPADILDIMDKISKFSYDIFKGK